MHAEDPYAVHADPYAVCAEDLVVCVHGDLRTGACLHAVNADNGLGQKYRVWLFWQA